MLWFFGKNSFELHDQVHLHSATYSVNSSAQDLPPYQMTNVSLVLNSICINHTKCNHCLAVPH